MNGEPEYDGSVRFAHHSSAHGNIDRVFGIEVAEAARDRVAFETLIESVAETHGHPIGEQDFAARVESHLRFVSVSGL
jgi:hypothetical protein